MTNYQTAENGPHHQLQCHQTIQITNESKPVRRTTMRSQLLNRVHRKRIFVTRRGRTHIVNLFSYHFLWQHHRHTHKRNYAELSLKLSQLCFGRKFVFTRLYKRFKKKNTFLPFHTLSILLFIIIARKKSNNNNKGQRLRVLI